MRTFLYSIFVLFIGFSTTFAQFNKQSSDSIKIDKKQQNGQYAIRQLQEDVEDILSVSELSNASIVISVINLENGETF